MSSRFTRPTKTNVKVMGHYRRTFGGGPGAAAYITGAIAENRDTVAGVLSGVNSINGAIQESADTVFGEVEVLDDSGSFLFVGGQIFGANGAGGTMTWATPSPTTINRPAEQGNDYGYVAKYDASLNPLWVVTAGAAPTGGRDPATSVIAAIPLADGGAIVVGNITGATDPTLQLTDADGVARVSFAYTMNFAITNVWFARIDSSGMWQWLRGVGMTNTNSVESVQCNGGAVQANGNVLLSMAAIANGTNSVQLLNPTASIQAFAINVLASFATGLMLEIDPVNGDEVSHKLMTRTTSTGLGDGGNFPVMGPKVQASKVAYGALRLGVKTPGVTSASIFGPGEANQRSQSGVSEDNQCFQIGFRKGYVGRYTAASLLNDFTSVVESQLAETTDNQRDIFVYYVDTGLVGEVAWAGGFEPYATSDGGTPFTQQLTATSDNFTTPSSTKSTFSTTAKAYMPHYGVLDATGALAWFKTAGTGSDAPVQDLTRPPVNGMNYDLAGRLFLLGRMQSDVSVQVLDQGLGTEKTFSNTTTGSTGTKGYLCQLDPATGVVNWGQRVNLAGDTVGLHGQACSPYSTGKMAWGVSAGSRGDLLFDPAAALGSTLTIAPPTGAVTGTNAAVAILDAVTGAMQTGRVLPDSQTGTTLGLTVTVVRASVA